MNSKNFILRETDHAPLVNKDDFLTSEDFDNNVINTYEDFVSLQATDYVDAYSNVVTYGISEYVTYGGVLYVSVQGSVLDVTPGTDENYWVDAFPSILAHIKNRDTILDEGGADEVTAAEIRAFIDGGLTTTTDLSITTRTSTTFKLNSSTGADVTVPQATETLAGLMTSTQRNKLETLSGTNTGDQTLVSLGAEAVANKATDFTTSNDTLYPTVQAVETFVAGEIGGINLEFLYFAESENTSSPNDTVNIQVLTPVSGSTNSDFALIPKGTGALLSSIPDNTATGGNKRGANAVDFQTVRTSNIYVASGDRSFLGAGKNNRATNTNAFVGAGEGNTSSGLYSFVGAGLNNTANNTYSVVLGGYQVVCSGLASQGGGYEVNSGGTGTIVFGFSCDGLGDYSNVSGKDGSDFSLSGRKVYGGNKFAVIGDKQVSKYVLGKRTTNATPTTLTTNNGAGYPSSVTNEIILRNNQYVRYKGTIIVKETGTTNVACWDIDGTVVRGASAGTTVVNVTNVTAIENVPAYTAPTVTADTANGSFVINVTGVASTNLQWVSNIEVTELIY